MENKTFKKEFNELPTEELAKAMFEACMDEAINWYGDAKVENIFGYGFSDSDKEIIIFKKDGEKTTELFKISSLNPDSEKRIAYLQIIRSVFMYGVRAMADLKK